MLTDEAIGKLIIRELVEVLMLKILPAVPVETLEIKLLIFIFDEAKFLLASVTTRLLAVKVAMLTLPMEEICKKLEPEEEATTNRLEVCDDVAIIKAVGWVVEEEATVNW